MDPVCDQLSASAPAQLQLVCSSYQIRPSGLCDSTDKPAAFSPLFILLRVLFLHAMLAASTCFKRRGESRHGCMPVGVKRVSVATPIDGAAAVRPWSRALGYLQSLTKLLGALFLHPKTSGYGVVAAVLW